MNANETALANALQKRGYTVISKGWPDLLVWSERQNGKWMQRGPRSEHVFAVECKVGSDRLSAEQQVVHRVLQAGGIPVYVGNAMDMPPTKGRKLAIRPREYGELVREVEDLRLSLQLAESKIAFLAKEIDASSVVFDPSQQPVSLSFLDGWDKAIRGETNA